jgi:CzcA family heavy metal efflux pump
MWIVRLALRRPYTFVVMAIAIALLGSLAIVRTPTDIFPQINIPVVSVIWSYSGMAPDEMEGRIVTICERAMTTTVNSIEHIESQSLNGVAVIRVFFQPDAKIEAAVAEVTAINQTLLRIMPPGTTPPLIIRYSASNVPILQAALTSETLSEQQLYDYGLNFIRTQLATVQGAQVPLPFGGKARQVMVDLDQDALFAKGLSPIDVSNAVNAQNVILPSGTAKMGDVEYNIRTNSSPDILEALNDIPVRQLGGSTVYLRDVAQVRDGYAVQTSMVHADGRRSAMLSVLKTPFASTLDIVRRVKQTLPRIESTLPPELNVKLLFDQSLFVKAALAGVVREAAIAAGLTAVMILVFLGSWRSTLVIALSIPLSILASVAVLAFLGETLNVMTLGGLALAVGILVDDATVEIENIHRNLGMGKPIVQAILDGAREIATPAFVSTLAICIVFVPVAFLSGAGKYLFTPLALAVVFAMLASYLLSRTVVPTLVRYLLPGELDRHAQSGHSNEGWIERAHAAFNRRFERLRDRYAALLSLALRHRLAFAVGFAAFVAVSMTLFPFLGEDFFPDVDAGQFRLHVRCAPGTRIEETEQVFAAVEGSIRKLIPADEIDTVLDNIGIAGGGVNLAFTDSSTVSSADGEILVALNREHHAPTERYVEALRSRLRSEFPGVTFFFQSADIVSQILNFGLPAPIDVQIVGRSPKNVDLAEEVRRRVAAIPGAADVHLQQVTRAPEIAVDVDRTLASELGLTQRDVASSLLVSLSSSGQAAPNYWLNRQNGVNYQVAVQTPQYRMDSIDALGNTPIMAPALARPQLLTNVASTRRTFSPAVISHYNVQPVVDVLASVQRSDLGSVMRGVEGIVADVETRLPRGSFVSIRGQAQSMQASFSGLAFGLVFAVVLVYLLMVVNFQSWLDPLIILMALPGAASGICWMLFVTQTTISVPALMGAIMSIGVATSNSILMITFANDQRREGLDAKAAALSAGSIRLRPVLMTALAMVLGMLPMALGFGEGGEQNAPLGRAVIGGLSIATLATLFFVPVVYSVLRRKQPPPAGKDLEDEPEPSAS